MKSSRPIRTALGASTVLLLAGCGNGGAFDPDASPVGTYALESVDGSELPFTLLDDGTLTVELLSGQFTMHEDGTATTWSSTKSTLSGQRSAYFEADSIASAWTKTNGTIRITSPGEAPLTAMWTGDVLSYVAVGRVFLYER